MIRAVRIITTATFLAAAFRFSQQLSEAWGNPRVEGYNVAIGVVCLLFLIRAAATEFAGKKFPDFQKDILWGISLGAFVSLVARLTTT